MSLWDEAGGAPSCATFAAPATCLASSVTTARHLPVLGARKATSSSTRFPADDFEDRVLKHPHAASTSRPKAG